VFVLLAASARADGTFQVVPGIDRSASGSVSPLAARLLNVPPGYAMSPDGVLYAPTARDGFVYVPGFGVVIGGALPPDFGGMRAPANLQDRPIRVYGRAVPRTGE
jgi:hypothetical protein